jgi:hypothetical protein
MITNRSPADAGLSQALRHAERVAYGPPYRLGVLTVGQRLVNGPATQLGQDIILRHAVGIAIAELLTHPIPELRQPHPRQRKRDPTPAQRQGRLTGLGRTRPGRPWARPT